MAEGVERLILAVDTDTKQKAESLMKLAKEVGVRCVKLGLELMTNTSPAYAADLAGRYDMKWVADAKLLDIPNTVVGAVRGYTKLEHYPFGITMHASGGREMLELAQETARPIAMLAVTVLTSLKEEVSEIYGADSATKVMQMARMAAAAGVTGLVCSPLEVGLVKGDIKTSGLFTMIPGIRSAGASSGDQARIGTPRAAIEAGADLLVIGRQVTESKNPVQSFDDIVAEVDDALAS